MPLLVLAIALLVGLALIALLPLSLVLRFRAGAARRRARGWLATLNVAGFVVSVPIFLATSALTSLWAPGTFATCAIALCVGAALGILGVWVTRWESTPAGLHYRPNRWVVLAITAVVAGRLVFGAWRAWARWSASPHDLGWLAHGAAGSLAAGGVVLGYYAAYWLGVHD